VENSIAQSLRLGYTNTIAVIIGDVSNPFFAIQMKEVETYARRAGYNTFLINTNEDEQQEEIAIKSALNQMVAGIIICPTQKSDKNILFLKKSGIPFVLQGRRFSDLDTDYVVVNDELGGYLATHHLIEKHHHNILCLHGPLFISSARERLAGYERAMREAGFPIDPALEVEVPALGEGFSEAFLSVPFDSYSGIFAFSDMVAWEAWAALKEHGLDVPKDKALIGFDNIESRLVLPFNMTSVSSFKGKMAMLSVDILLKRIRHDKTSSYKLVIDPAVKEGDTV
jgi:LacI family transcriptional regulator